MIHPSQLHLYVHLGTGCHCPEATFLEVKNMKLANLFELEMWRRIIAFFFFFQLKKTYSPVPFRTLQSVYKLELGHQSCYKTKQVYISFLLDLPWCYFMKFLPRLGSTNRFASLGKNLKIAPGKHPGILKVSVKKDCMKRKLRNIWR